MAMTRSWALAALGLAAACTGEQPDFSSAFLMPPRASDPVAPGAPARERPTWTVLVYGHADHDLSNTLLSDMAEMAGARLGPEVNLVVFADWDASRAISGDGGHFPSGSFWYHVRGQGHDLERYREGPELDFDDPAVLAGAIEQAFTEFPADRHGLVLWDHGGAWAVGFGGDSQDGQRRQTAGLPMQEVAAAVRAGLRQAGLGRDRALDFLAFDACLMGGAETITAFEDVAAVFIADAELDYGDGWDYQATFSRLSDEPAATPRELAALEVAAWDAHHRQASPNDSLLRSHVAIDTAAWERLVGATRRLVQAVGRSPGPAEAALALQSSVPAYRSMIATPGGASNLRDLGDVLAALAAASDRAVAAGAASALGAALSARIAVSAGLYREEQLGVHVFSGPPLGLTAADLAAYPRRAGVWSGASGWLDLLGRLRAVADADPPQLAAATTAGTAVSFEVVGDDAARVDISVLRPTGNQTAVLQGTVASSFVRPGRYDVSWTGKLWEIGAEPTPAPVTIEPWIWQLQAGALQAPILASPGRLRSSAGEELDCDLLVDAETLQAHALALVSDGRPVIFDLADVREADPGAAFFPIQTAVDLRTGQPRPLAASLGVTVPASGRLSVRAVPAAAGAYLVQVRAVDVWGNQRDTLFPVTAR
jgi:hypothetical protein